MDTSVPLADVSCRHVGSFDGRSLPTRYRLNLGATSGQSRCVTSVLSRRKKQAETVETAWDDSPADVAEIETDDAPDVSHMDDRYLLELIRTNKTDSLDNPTLSQSIYLRACKQLGVTHITYLLNNLGCRELTLRNQPLTPRDVKACALALSGNTKVETLDLSCDNICPTSLVYLTTMIEDNNYISTLKLGENELGTEGARILADCLSTNRSIDVLDISGNKFKEMDAIHLKRMIQKNTSLRELDLSHNELREKGAEILASGIETNKTLESIDLSWNHIRRKGATAIALALQKNRTLARVNLSWNGLYVQGCTAIATALQTNTTLKELDISCNRIDVECVGILAKLLAKNSSLETIRLANNPLTTGGATLLVNTIRENASSGIQQLHLGEQPVDKEFISALESLRETRPVLITHGILMRQDLATEEEEDNLINESPMAVLQVFMKMRNLRLHDLFISLDKDGSRSLTKTEIKQGLQDLTIPLSEKALDKLIDKLDVDKDGEIDFGELMAGHKEQKRKNAKAIASNDVDLVNMKTEQTERIIERLKELMNRKARKFWEHINNKKARASLVNGTQATSESTREEPQPPRPPGEMARRKSMYLMQVLKITRKSSVEEPEIDPGRNNGKPQMQRRQSVFGIRPWNDNINEFSDDESTIEMVNSSEVKLLENSDFK